MRRRSVGSRTNARNHMSVVRSRVRFTCSHVLLHFCGSSFLCGLSVSQVPKVSLQYVASRRYLTMPVLFEAVGDCGWFLANPCGPCSETSCARQQHQAVSVPLGPVANWSSTESNDKAVQRYECEVDQARGDASLRNLC